MVREGMADAPPPGRFRVSEIYLTIQGESSLAGMPAVFVRLYACNLRCVWCDTMHAVEGGDFREASVDEVVGRVLEVSGATPDGGGIRGVCWTGGEPLLQWRSIADAIRALPEDFVHCIETDGEISVEPLSDALPERRASGRLRFIMDVKCPGSGIEAKVAFENFAHLRGPDEVKFVVLDRADYEFAREVVAKHDIPAGTVLFSPVVPARTAERGLTAAKLAGWILEDKIPVRLQLQVHKLIWPGVDRGT